MEKDNPVNRIIITTKSNKKITHYTLHIKHYQL